ncbi:MAG: hypothetical protein EBX50_17925, partial [Chitinophagia bacterium]|nr:hypothetical protein [Chitinophagia bacterium]
MKTIFKILTLIGILYSINSIHAQLETKHWFMKDSLYLQSQNGVLQPTLLPNGIGFSTTSSIVASDRNGNLLFTTDILNCYDRNHQLMPNGTSLLNGLNNCGQQYNLLIPPPILLPWPMDSNKYIIMQYDYYHVVDMNLNSGMGDLAIKNQRIWGTNQQWISGLSTIGVPHCNGSDAWILTHGRGNNTFFVYPVTSSGVGASPVISNAGTVHAINQWGGILLIKQDRKTLISIYTQFLNGQNQTHVDFLNFDNQTGQVNYTNGISFIIVGFSLQTASLSPDESKLYLSDPCIGGNIMQFDLSLGNGSQILNSGISLNKRPSMGVTDLFVSSNGKIYYTEPMQKNIGVIDYPNIAGIGCSLQDSIISLQNYYGPFQFPVFMPSSRSPYPHLLSADSLGPICSNDTLTLQADTTAGWGWQWQRNGVDIPGATASSLQVTQAGDYRVVLILQPSGCIGNSSTTVTVITQAAPTIPMITKSGDTLSASGGGVGTWQWYQNNTLIPGATNTTYVSTQAGTYTVRFTNTAGCSAVSTAITLTSLSPDYRLAGYQVFPNPAKEELYIQSPITGQLNYR